MREAFRVHLPPDTLTQADLRVGQVCQIKDANDRLIGHGIAWRATDRLGNKPKVSPVMMTETLRNAFGIEEGSHVSVSKTTANILLADKVVLQDVTPTEYGTRQQLEDRKWHYRCAYQLSRSPAPQLYPS